MKLGRIIIPCILLISIEQGSVMADNDHNDDLSTSEPITNGIHRGSVPDDDPDRHCRIDSGDNILHQVFDWK